MISRILIAIAIACSLSACCDNDNVPYAYKYKESQAMKDHFDTLVPEDARKTIDTVSVCKGNYEWNTTILFKNGNIFNYQIDLYLSKVNLTFKSTLAERTTKSENSREYSPNLGCIESSEDYLGYEGRRKSGLYRFEIKDGVVKALVPETVVVSTPFDQEIKDQLKAAAHAIASAVDLNSKSVDPQISWAVVKK